MKSVHSHSFFLVLGLCIMGVVTAVYGYMYHEVGAALGRAADARNELNSASALRQKEQSFMSLYQSTASEWAELPNYFIPANDVVSFIKSIEALSRQSGARVTLSSIGADSLDGAAPGTQGNVRAHVSATGSWANVMRALSLAEASPYKVTINNVNMAASAVAPVPSPGVSDKGAASSEWSLSFDLTAAMIVPFATSTHP